MPDRRSSMTIVALLLSVSTVAIAQSDDAASWSASLARQYQVRTDITYLTSDGYQSQLDVVTPWQPSGPLPTVIYIHGGGWVGGAKEASTLSLLPYLEMGFAAVNVEYRLAKNALAPAAVEDCRCALRWVLANAEEYGFDPDRLVVTGHSAGGHLSLTTGMLPASAGLDRRCPATRDPGAAGSEEPEMSVAAIVNWFGITDVGDLLEGENAKTYAVAWMGSQLNRMEIAERVSPLSYVRADVPPILTIHGNRDMVVPYRHGVRLHEALDRVGATHRLFTVEGGGHGTFPAADWERAFVAIRQFLDENVAGVELDVAESTSP